MLPLLPLGDKFPTFRNAGSYSAGETTSNRGIPLSSATHAVDGTCVRVRKGNISNNPKINVDITLQIMGRDSSVAVATRYGLDGPGIESRWGRDLPHPSIPALGSTQPPVQWVPDISRG